MEMDRPEGVAERRYFLAGASWLAEAVCGFCLHFGHAKESFFGSLEMQRTEKPPFGGSLSVKKG